MMLKNSDIVIIGNGLRNALLIVDDQMIPSANRDEVPVIWMGDKADLVLTDNTSVVYALYTKEEKKHLLAICPETLDHTEPRFIGMLEIFNPQTLPRSHQKKISMFQQKPLIVVDGIKHATTPIMFIRLQDIVAITNEMQKLRYHVPTPSAIQ